MKNIAKNLLILTCLVQPCFAINNISDAKLDNFLQHDKFKCISEPANESCKLICSTENNPNHFVKSWISNLQMTFKPDGSFYAIGDSKNATKNKTSTLVNTETTDEPFFGYFTKNTNCMVFNLLLTN